jgi:hypothetical protein
MKTHTVTEISLAISNLFDTVKEYKPENAARAIIAYRVDSDWVIAVNNGESLDIYPNDNACDLSRKDGGCCNGSCKLMLQPLEQGEIVVWNKGYVLFTIDARGTIAYSTPFESTISLFLQACEAKQQLNLAEA